MYTLSNVNPSLLFHRHDRGQMKKCIYALNGIREEKNVGRYIVRCPEKEKRKIKNGFNPGAFVIVIEIRRLTLKRLALVRKTRHTSAGARARRRE